FYEASNFQQSGLSMEELNKFNWYSFQHGILDSEHDLYQFNFMGHTGRFIIKMTNPSGMLEVVKLDNDNTISIRLDYDLENHSNGEKKYIFNGFTVFDDKGYKYIFGVKETTTETRITSTASLKSLTTFIQPELPFSFVSSFHLSKIYDNNDNLLVEFTYYDSIESIIDSSLILNH